MNERLLELAARRGELTARIGMQRETLVANAHPLVTVLAAADQAAAGAEWLKRRPAVVAAAVAALLILRPGRVFRWGRRLWFLAQGLRILRGKLGGLI